MISIANIRTGRPKLLVIESDPCVASHILSIFDRRCLASDSPAESQCRCVSTDGAACCRVFDSIAALHDADLSDWEVAICGGSLSDGSGLDVLAYLMGTRADLPVILHDPESSMAVEAIRGGALDFVVAPTLAELDHLPLSVEKCLAHQRIKLENERLHRDLKRSLAELAVTNQQLQAMINRLEDMARTDDLTGLANRRWFNLMLHGNWAEATRNDLPLACLMIDLDGFKAVNDRLGHHHGDQLLCRAARVLQANCREVDVAARYGGDEFCVLMAHTEPHEAAAVAERILREFQIAMSDRAPGEPVLGMSLGLAHINVSRPINAEQLVSHADEAMYAAKAAGKQRVMIRGADGVYAPMRNEGSPVRGSHAQP